VQSSEFNERERERKRGRGEREREREKRRRGKLLKDANDRRPKTAGIHMKATAS
jgi:hypothetical protein